MAKSWDSEDFARVPDMPDTGSTAYPAAEKAYRRGFAQAAGMIVEALRAGVTVDELDDWLDNVDAWREFELDTPHPPPLPPKVGAD